MTSLIDLFMILLVFLIKNFSASPEATLYSNQINLPISSATKHPELNITITATQQDLLLNGEFVESLGNIADQKELLYTSLYEKLIYEKDKTRSIAQLNPQVAFFGQVIVQADKEISYKIIKRILYTCGQAEFGKISLHVLMKE